MVKKSHPALKHAGYSATTLLPGEDPDAFKRLHQNLIAELAPNGALEEDIVGTIARLVWRKQNLKTFRIAERTRKRCSEIRSEKIPYRSRLLDMSFMGEEEIDPAVRAAANQAAEDQARAEFGPEYAFVEMGEEATVDELMKELVVQGQLDAMIDRNLKRLLFLRGLKSISTPSASERRPRLSASTKAL